MALVPLSDGASFPSRIPATAVVIRKKLGRSDGPSLVHFWPVKKPCSDLSYVWTLC